MLKHFTLYLLSPSTFWKKYVYLWEINGTSMILSKSVTLTCALMFRSRCIVQTGAYILYKLVFLSHCWFHSFAWIFITLTCISGLRDTRKPRLLQWLLQSGLNWDECNILLVHVDLMRSIPLILCCSCSRDKPLCDDVVPKSNIFVWNKIVILFVQIKTWLLSLPNLLDSEKRL